MTASVRTEWQLRLMWLKIGLLASFAVVAGRLVQIQVIRAAEYQEKARRQSEVQERLPGTRGNLIDRNGRILVSNTIGVSYGVDPKMLKGDPGEIAGRFARAFGKSRSEYLQKLTDQSRRFVWLERRASQRTASVIRASETPGLVQIQEPYRLYHYGRLAGQVIGSTDIDNRGLSGIELQLDGALRGADGYVILQRDGKGGRRRSMDYPRHDPTVGCSATLTIDIEYQGIVEEELARGIERAGAESGLAVLLDPATGEVLAMANYPPMDPARPGEASQLVMRNRAVTDLVEPGSVFKVVAASAALERGLVKPEQKFDGENGIYLIKLASGKLRNKITDTHPHGMISFQQAVEFSSNIVIAKISDRIGAELLFITARNYGFGTETGIDLPGEINGDLKMPSDWSGTTLNSMSYGYEVGVTPLQIAAAYAAVANRGELLKPYIVQKVVDAEGDVVSENRRQFVRNVVGPGTAKILTQFFEGVVNRGTGSLAAVPGIRVAGKTGTARKFIDGAYEIGRNTASFVGFFPAEDPRVVALVMLDHPKVGGATGGESSAPIFRAIAAKIFAMSGRFQPQERTAVAQGSGIVVPDVRSLAPDVAKEILSARGFAVEVNGNGNAVRQQSPRPGTTVNRGTAVRLTTMPRQEPLDGFAEVPDLRGMPIRRAINTLTMHELEAAVRGNGVVTDQAPHAGERVRIGTRVALRCVSRAATIHLN